MVSNNELTKVKYFGVASYTGLIMYLMPSVIVLMKLFKAGKIFQNYCLNGLSKIKEKCYLLMSVNEVVTTTIGFEEITSSRAEKLLGVTFDRELKRASHINGL